MTKTFTDIEQALNKASLLYGKNFNQKERYEKALNSFKNKFGYNEFYLASSSGRVEVLGNHTDHNGGKVMCSAISLDSLAFFMPNGTDTVHIFSEGYRDISIDINKVENINENNSIALVKGIIFALKERGYSVGGFDAYITSNVLGGAGISSSASFEVLITEIFNFLFNEDKIDNQTKAYISQFSENVYFGKPCGLLDQTAIAFGGMKTLDFGDKEKIAVSDVENNCDNFTFVLINTGGSHANLTDEFASIPFEMKQIASYFGKDRLIDVDENEFFNSIKLLKGKFSDRAILRAEHFFNENKRVESASLSLKIGDFDSFIKCINQSGESSLEFLQNCYVSGDKNQPIPLAISIAKRYIKNGAVRVHGGGFAGCILCIVENDNLKEFIDNMSNYFDQKDIIVLSVRSVGTIVL